jgi:histidine phosphotransferase ChpT
MTLFSRNKDTQDETMTQTPTNEQARSAALLDPAVLELLVSRICHDIISPVGAIHNGVEFLEEMGMEGSDDAIELLAHSAKTASAKLMAFRIVYGLGGSDPSIKPEDIHKIFGELISCDGKITQDWDPYMDFGFEERPNGFCKMLIGGLMLAQESLPKGGAITVQYNASDDCVEIHATAEDTLVRAQVEDALALKLSPQELDPRLVHPFALATLAAHYHYEIKIKSAVKDRVVYAVTRVA